MHLCVNSPLSKWRCRHAIFYRGGNVWLCVKSACSLALSVCVYVYVCIWRDRSVCVYQRADLSSPIPVCMCIGICVYACVVRDSCLTSSLPLSLDKYVCVCMYIQGQRTLCVCEHHTSLYISVRICILLKRGLSVRERTACLSLCMCIYAYFLHSERLRSVLMWMCILPV